MVNESIIFVSAYGLVFFLGFQSLSVNSGHYWLAGINSLIIGSFNLFLYKTVPHVSGTVETAAYLVGGPLGIMSAMWVHRNVVTPMREASEQRKRFNTVAEVCVKSGGRVL